MKIRKGAEEGRIKELQIQNDVLWYRNRLCVPNVLDIKKELLKEAHNSAFITHPGSTKMYHDLKMHFWWIGMKSYVARSLHVKE